MILLKRKRIFVLIAVFTLLILISGSASSATLYVKEGGTGSYENLQEAIDAAYEGDIILVEKGQYSENVLVNKSLEISSTNRNPEKTVITALDPEAPAFHIVSDSVKISGFSIKGANSTYGIYLDGVSESNITNNYFSGNWRSIALNNSHGNILKNNRLESSDNGIWLESSERNLIKDNKAKSNRHYGFYLNSSENNTLQNNCASEGAVGIYLEDSSGCRISGSKTLNNFYGIYLTGSGESLLEKNTANSNEMYGIYLGNSNGSILRGNKANSNHWGIYLDSSFNILQKNKMSRNSRNFGAYTYHYTGEMNNSIDTSNKVDGKSIYYLSGVSDLTLDSNSSAGVVYCINCENITLKDLGLENSSFGVYLYNSQNSLLEGCSISNCEHGIYLGNCSMTALRGNDVNSNEGNAFILSSCRNCPVEDNSASNNMAGIWLCDTSTDNVLKENTVSSSSWCCVDLGDTSCNNTLEGNILSEAYEGIYLYGSSEENTLNNNTITASSYGLYTEGCGNNTISGNRILGNNIGISLNLNWTDGTGSDFNIIYNNYLNNSRNAEDFGTNSWNISKIAGVNIAGGPYLGGNLWVSPQGNGFSETASDGDGDMISDLPYNVTEANCDYLPLISGKTAEDFENVSGKRCRRNR
ncbi:right-handed parallel beta-helix repeat-containing protein [Methanosarcina mazei]|jgi:parallel beta-helix repeat protein|uniref:Cell surface protein n=1 Tax=Methanosarcina mazei TaxID=2209 RepID=A0A4P8QXQ2_METMZ|nr:NosD domain-containing protein [Methanosarcina mazei]QCR16368.1 cell surface protein [Methanosarcina mazei]